MFGKKGVSAIIATVLIIMIVVAAVAVVWSFVIPMIKGSLSDSTSEKAKLSIETAGGYTTWDEELKIARVQVKRGNDKTNLTGIDFNFIRQGNSKQNISSEIPQNGQTKVYEFNLSDFGKPEKIEIAPITAKGVGSVVSASNVIQNYTGGILVCIYSDWSPCNSSGFKNKTKLSSSPLGCNGTSVLVQSCNVQNQVYLFKSISTNLSFNGLNFYNTSVQLNGYNVYYDSTNQYSNWYDGTNWIFSKLSDANNISTDPNWYPQTITISGAGSPGVNGIWSLGGIFDSVRSWTKEGMIIRRYNSLSWSIEDSDPNYGYEQYYSITSTQSVPPKINWIKGDNAELPVPILSYEDAPLIIDYSKSTLQNGSYSGQNGWVGITLNISVI